MDLFEGVPIIHSYTRSQAIEDGVLRDVTEQARETGFKYPTAVTVGVWSKCVALSEAAKEACNDERGRLHDVLWMAACAAGGVIGKRDGDRTHFSLFVVTDNALEPEEVALWAVCGPGDTPEPCVTILLEGED